MKTRTEKDSLGEIQVDCKKYWGAQTQRSLENFSIGTNTMPMEVIYAFALIKKAAALTNYELGSLSREKADIISKVCDEITAGKLDSEFPLSVWQTGSGTHTNMNLNEVIANRSHVLLGNQLGQGERLVCPNDDVNQSQSSNDTFSSAMNMAACKLIFERTIPGLEKLRESLDEKSNEFKDILKVGRTHLMDAVPITLGQEFSAYTKQLDYSLKSLRNALINLHELALGGTAVGTGLNAKKNFSKLVCKKVSELSHYSFKSGENKFALISSHDALVEGHSALKQLAVGLMKMGNDIRLLSSGPRSGIGELELPTNEPGSSIMPGKVNPTQCESLTMVCSQVLGNDVALTIGSMSGQLELNTFKPLIIYNFIESATLLGDSCFSFSKNCVQGIKPNRQKIDKTMESSLMLATALSPHIGYSKTAEIVKQAYLNNSSLREEAIKSGHVSLKNFELWVNPRRMI